MQGTSRLHIASGYYYIARNNSHLKLPHVDARPKWETLTADEFRTTWTTPAVLINTDNIMRQKVSSTADSCAGASLKRGCHFIVFLSYIGYYRPSVALFNVPKIMTDLCIQFNGTPLREK